jgi:hypothetical protein
MLSIKRPPKTQSTQNSVTAGTAAYQCLWDLTALESGCLTTGNTAKHYG